MIQIVQGFLDWWVKFLEGEIKSIEHFYVIESDDISQDGNWEVRSTDPKRGKGCEYCKDTGFEDGAECYMCNINEWIASFSYEEDARRFAEIKNDCVY